MSERAEFAARITGNMPCIAFYYGAQDPAHLLSEFGVAVVDPGHAHAPGSAAHAGPQWLAYVSLGETLASAPYFDAMPPSWRIGRNAAWDTWIIDQTPPDWPGFLAEQIARPIRQKGYRGFFLDTVDSYALLGREPDAAALQRAGLARAIQGLRDAFPHTVIVLNRGFELLPDIHQAIDAVAFESLYHGWNQSDRSYHPVSGPDRAWLLAQAEQARSYGLPVIAIDYCAPQARALARDIQERIRRHGIVPYVTDGGLQRIYRHPPAQARRLPRSRP